MMIQAAIMHILDETAGSCVSDMNGLAALVGSLYQFNLPAKPLFIHFFR